jgi:hypothetical protein
VKKGKKIILKRKDIFVLILFSALFFPHKAHAYIDLGTGSYLLQIAIGLFIGMLFSLKLFWQRVRAFITRLFQKKEK